MKSKKKTKRAKRKPGIFDCLDRPKKDHNPWNDLRVRHACPRVSEKIGDRIQIFPPDAATLQGWIDGSIKPPVQGARLMLIALAREVLTWRERNLQETRCSVETKSGTFQIQIPKKAMDRIRSLLGGGQ